MASKASEIAKEFDPRRIDDPIQGTDFRGSVPERVIEKVLRDVMLKRLLSVPEAAIYLGRGIDAVRELVYRREIRVVQRGEKGKVYLDKADLDTWIEKNKRFSGEK